MAFNNNNNKGNFNRNNNNGRRPQRNNDRRPPRREQEVEKEVWVPKTQLGKDVLAGKYPTMTDVLNDGHRILEHQITDYLIPNMSTELINLGQAKGKFGGGKRKPSKPTQKITKEGSKMSFSVLCVSGNKDGIVGLGFGKSREAVPSREKAVVSAKKDLIVIRRGSGSWGSFGAGSTSIPFAVEGKSGSCKVRLMPAPVGTGLVAEAEIKKMLELAGIQDVWSKTFGSTKNKINLMKACFDALKNLQKVRLTEQVAQGRGLKEGERNEQY